MYGRERKTERGSAFFVVLILAIASIALIASFLATSHARVRDVELQSAEASAFAAAESGLNRVVEMLWVTYRDADPKTRVQTLEDVDGHINPVNKITLVDQDLGGSTYDVEVRKVHIVPGEYADVEMISHGENPRASHTLRAVVRYGHAPSQVFDHAYFINNFGWLWGAGVTVNGSVRSNGNFSVKSATVNGDIWASENDELGASGAIEGDVRIKDVDWYNNYYGDRARPTNPSAPTEDLNGNGVLDAGEDLNGNGKLDEYDFKDGYDGTPEHHAHMPKVNMPYLGDLTVYSDLAKSKGGKLYHGGKVVVDAVLGDGALEDKNLVLIGTAADPIIIDGPVVVTNDVVLKGVIKGQGTIYAGRNVHIIGSLRYVDPPSWPKPMTNESLVTKQNATKDLVGLAAKGSVIMGDYTGSEWSAVTRRYQTPPFTQPYKVHETDAANGYVSYRDKEGNPVFDGNYRAFDGGQKLKSDGTTEPRRYYESSLPDELIRSLADEQIRQVDAIIYTNHLLSGKVGSAQFNGTLVSRDEAIIYDGSLEINYDIRTRHGSYEFLDVYLPRDPDRRIVFWGEGK